MSEAQPAQAQAPAKNKQITLEDCKSHNKEEDCWLVIGGKVYDVTEFLDEHPGGFDIVLAACGTLCACPHAVFDVALGMRTPAARRMS